MTHATDERPVDENENDPHAPDEAHVQRLLQDGPQGPHGRVAMAAAGVDVDRQFPVDAGDEPDEGAAEVYAEEDPSHFEDPDDVAVDTPAVPDDPGAPPEPESTAELLPADDKRAFLSRWNTIQIGFVEDPAQSVRDADALIEDISAAYVSAIAERRSALSATWQSEAGTEEMRRAVLQYRSLLGVILPG